MLKENIQKDLINSVKERKEIASLTLRMLLASIFNKEKDKKYKTKKEELSEEEVLEVVIVEAKKRKEAIAEFSALGGSASGGKKDKIEKIINKEKAELEILARYLPEQLSEEELKNIVKEAVKETKAESMKDMGKVMSQMKSKIKGRADGSQVSQIVKELLS